MNLLAAESARDNFVDLDVSLGWWVGLAVAIGLLLAVDLYRHRDDHEPTTRSALLETLVWISFGVAFSGVVAIGFGSEAFGEYISGYLIEKSLSIDNVFVWSILFSTMAIPLKFQHRVLFWGIFGALLLRLIFILVGAALISRFSAVLVIFGAFLVITGLRIIRHREDEGETTSTAGLGLLRRVMPVSDEYDGHNFFTVKNGVRMATPLFAALVVVEVTDVIFALDSVPAVLAVSNEPYIVFASNAFAILGLRAMYFLLADARQRFHYLSHALGAILVFVGVKMALSQWHHLDTFLSLGVILAILVAAIAFSELRTRREAAALVD
ncbi:MAG: tellurium resistance protein TerC [Acidimicrobiales bacterium]|nr:MAG: tellurium resistance protein TerC [Acidimicrobiales bacterium]